MRVLARTGWRPPGAQRFEQLLCLISYASPVSRIQSLILFLTQGLRFDCDGSYFGKFGKFGYIIISFRSVAYLSEPKPRLIRVHAFLNFLRNFSSSLPYMSIQGGVKFSCNPSFSPNPQFSYSIWRPRINKFRSWNQGGFAGLVVIDR